MCIASGVFLIGPILAAFGQCEVNELIKLPDRPDVGAGFGCSVSVSGDVAVVAGGSPFVLRFDGQNWTEEQGLIPSDAAQTTCAVSVSGDVLLIGAHTNDDHGPGTGSAYIFRFNGKQWVEEKKLSGANSGDVFGRAVAVSADVALVGKIGEVFVYRFDGTNWHEEATLTASDASFDFGRHIAINGNIVAVGDHAAGDRTQNAQGAAYIFRFNGTQWVEEQKLLASDGQSFDGFGNSVSVNGGVVLIGANVDDDNGGSSGSAYIFRFDGVQWVEEQKLLAEDAEAGDQFGVSVSVNGGVALVGAATSNDAGESSGSAYVFRFTGTQWVQQQKLLASDGEAFDIFGVSVSVFGDVAVVGASLDDPGGSVYVFTNLSECKTCVADLNGDGIVNAFDLATLLGAWGPCPK